MESVIHDRQRRWKQQIPPKCTKLLTYQHHQSTSPKPWSQPASHNVTSLCIILHDIIGEVDVSSHVSFTSEPDGSDNPTKQLHGPPSGSSAIPALTASLGSVTDTLNNWDSAYVNEFTVTVGRRRRGQTRDHCSRGNSPYEGGIALAGRLNGFRTQNGHV